MSRRTKVVACRVLDILKEKGMSQSDLARQLQVLPCSIHAVIHGRSEPMLTTARRIVDALGVSLDEAWPPDEPRPRDGLPAPRES